MTTFTNLGDLVRRDCDPGKTAIIDLSGEEPRELSYAVLDAAAAGVARALARSEGIFCGISSGGTFAAALRVAQEAPQGSVILAMLPDTGERYLSTVLFEGVSDAGDPEP